MTNKKISKLDNDVIVCVSKELEQQRIDLDLINKTICKNKDKDTKKIINRLSRDMQIIINNGISEMINERNYTFSNVNTDPWLMERVDRKILAYKEALIMSSRFALIEKFNIISEEMKLAYKRGLINARSLNCE